MDEINNNSLNEKLNRQNEEVRSKIKEEYPNSFEEFEKVYNNTFKTSYTGKTEEEVWPIFAIISKYEKFQSNGLYPLNLDLYNLSKIFRIYCKDIIKDKQQFIKDLLYLYVFGLIDIFIPSDNDEKFRKVERISTEIPDAYYFLKKICEINEAIQGERIEINAIVYFTHIGEQHRENYLGAYLIEKATISLEELKVENNKLKERQESLTNKMEKFNVEMITIIAIVISIAPLFAINISELKEFNIRKLLLINGCLIFGITTIFSIITLTFFDNRKKQFWLLVPLVLSMILIGLSFIVY